MLPCTIICSLVFRLHFLYLWIVLVVIIDHEKGASGAKDIGTTPLKMAAYASGYGGMSCSYTIKGIE